MRWNFTFCAKYITFFFTFGCEVPARKIFNVQLLPLWNKIPFPHVSFFPYPTPYLHSLPCHRPVSMFLPKENISHLENNRKMCMFWEFNAKGICGICVFLFEAFSFLMVFLGCVDVQVFKLISKTPIPPHPMKPSRLCYFYIFRDRVRPQICSKLPLNSNGGKFLNAEIFGLYLYYVSSLHLPRFSGPALNYNRCCFLHCDVTLTKKHI